ncbi:MAG: hypothetical protein WCC04_07645 [Terriglobales bacterium]
MTSRRVALMLVVFLAVLLTACGSSSSTASLSAALPDGTYVFHLAGEDYSTITQNSSPYFVAGAFTVSGGVITQGEEDFVDDTGVSSSLSIQAMGSSIATTSDGNLQIRLYTGLSGRGVNGTQTINAALVTKSSARIAEFDAAASGTGSLDLQSSTAQPSGGYAFFAAGSDKRALPIALGGILNIDNLTGAGTISGAGSVFDLNDAPTLGLFAAQVFSASAVSTPDSFGRVLFTLNPSNTSVGQIELVGYVVNATTIQLVEAGDILGATMGGTALGQGSNTGTFSNASLSGLTYVAGAQGQETAAGQWAVGAPLLNLAGALTFNADASMGGTISFNDLSTSAVPAGSINAGTYAADTNPGTGRVTVSGLTATNTTTTYGPVTLELYLDGTGNAFVISMDANDVTSGVAFQQTAGASVSGSYAMAADGTTTVTTTDPITGITTTIVYSWAGAGALSAGNGTATGFTDFNVLSNTQAAGSQTAGVALSGTSSGTGNVLSGTIGGLGVAATVNHYTYYVIDNNRAFAIETDAAQLSEAFAQTSTP